MDLKFPHHECEVAQGTASKGKRPVNYWLHTNMLTLNGKKMSKSTGNTLLPRELFSGNTDLLEKAYHPMVVRFFMMQAHYRSVLDFSSEALNAAEKGFQKLMTALKTLNDLKTNDTSSEIVEDKIKDFYSAMNDDFNTPILIAHLFDGVRFINSVNDGKASISKKDKISLTTGMHHFIFDVLGLDAVTEQNDSKLNAVMEVILEIRKNARANKDFGTSDLIRDKMQAAGITIKDSREGTTWTA
jgi:cysteinyl-tRNA synthetase